ncbi:hypothetical protein [Secundilactobacillus muriivasis]
MLIREGYITTNQINVQEQLLSLEQQANRHRRLNLIQLICMLLIVLTVVSVLIIQTPTALIKSVTVTHDVMSDPVIFSGTVIILIAFLTSWLAWMQDLKFNAVNQTFQQLIDDYQAVINTSLPLTALANDFQKKVHDATQFNMVNLTIVFGIMGGLLLCAIL